MPDLNQAASNTATPSTSLHQRGATRDPEQRAKSENRRHHVCFSRAHGPVPECHLPGMRSCLQALACPANSSQDKEKPMAVRSSNIVAARGASQTLKSLSNFVH